MNENTNRDRLFCPSTANIDWSATILNTAMAWAPARVPSCEDDIDEEDARDLQWLSRDLQWLSYFANHFLRQAEARNITKSDITKSAIFVESASVNVPRARAIVAKSLERPLPITISSKPVISAKRATDRKLE